MHTDTFKIYVELLDHVVLLIKKKSTLHIWVRLHLPCSVIYLKGMQVVSLWLSILSLQFVLEFSHVFVWSLSDISLVKFVDSWPNSVRKTKRELILRTVPAGKSGLCMSSLCLLKILYQGGVLHPSSCHSSSHPSQVCSVTWLLLLLVPSGESIVVAKNHPLRWGESLEESRRNWVRRKLTSSI